jgi:hypothetical protein
VLEGTERNSVELKVPLLFFTERVKGYFCNIVVRLSQGTHGAIIGVVARPAWARLASGGRRGEQGVARACKESERGRSMRARCRCTTPETICPDG